MKPEKQSIVCELIYNNPINKEIFRLDFTWPGSRSAAQENTAQTKATQTKFAPPRAGQFFMVKPKRSAIFLARPISMALWQAAAEDREFIRRKARSKSSPYQRYLTGKYLESDTVAFFVALRGSGTHELAVMRSGEEAELTGPLGNTWMDFLPLAVKDKKKPIALVGGGIGIAPLIALLCEETGYAFETYAGFRTGLTPDQKRSLLGAVYLETGKVIMATEDGKDGLKGRIPDFLEPEKYAAVCACGPQPMMKAVAAKCKAASVPCFVSMERRMACGVGACLGCTVQTVNGNRRCCADGPIFNAEEIIFEE
jgi:NAD(P)H-flavin reductase